MTDASSRLLSVSYTPVGDLVVVSVCLVLFALIAFTYIRKTPAFRVFLFIVSCLMLAAMLNVTGDYVVRKGASESVAHLWRCLFHASLLTVFLHFTIYIIQVTHLKAEQRTPILSVTSALLMISVAMDALPGRDRLVSRVIFIVSYLCFAAIDIALLAALRHRLYRRAMLGFYSSVAISFIILLLQIFLSGGSSFTVASFLFPVLAMFHIVHPNTYDMEIGAIDVSVLRDIVKESHEKKRRLIFMSLYMPAFSGEGKQIPESIHGVIRRFSADYFRSALLFQLDNGHLLLLFRKDKNPDYEHRVEEILQAFLKEHQRYHFDYKIVFGESIDQISRRNEYVSFIQSIHRYMPLNSIHRVSPEDITSFDRSEQILQQLLDIHQRHDLDDERVLVYCQPVFNVETGQYDTAEALMRLQLDELGLVFPDQFIHLAEDHGYIHTLTEIILHKVCNEIRELNRQGYRISRISVNVSVLELKSDRFCDDINGIIDDSGISGDRVAIELTESQSESDFDLMKSKIEELKKRGITFYLDDFGTGYSNMERIIELPFDIIKFDRSLVAACSVNARSEKIIHNMANLFSDLHYSVLYEGVENELDENLCREMSASYLQGYKFSRPIPIAQLRKFLSREENAG